MHRTHTHMNGAPGKTYLSPLFSFLSSVKLTIVLLVALAGMGFLGMVLPQQEDFATLSSSLPHSVSRLLTTLQLHDIFHSVWFYVVMGLLTLNLLSCSVTYFPQAWKRFRGGSMGKRKIRFRREDTFLSPLSPAEFARKCHTLLRRRRYTILKEPPTPHHLRANAGAISHLGVYLVHGGVLLLILGAMMSTLFGMTGFINIKEGEVVDRAVRRGTNDPWALPFQIRLDRFFVEYYDNGMPKQYRSDITVLKGGRIYVQGSILVNHPLDIDGIHLYQASYGELPTGYAKLSISREGKTVAEVRVRGEGSVFTLPDSSARVSVLRIEENFMDLGPAVKLAVRSGHQETVFWIFKNWESIQQAHADILKQAPLMNPGRYRPYTFALEAIESTHYSGLHVRRDPGAPLVGIAAIIITIGLIVTYFIPYRELIISWEETSPQGVRVTVTAISNSYAKSLVNDIDRLRRGLSSP